MAIDWQPIQTNTQGIGEQVSQLTNQAVAKVMSGLEYAQGVVDNHKGGFYLDPSNYTNKQAEREQVEQNQINQQAQRYQQEYRPDLSSKDKLAMEKDAEYGNGQYTGLSGDPRNLYRDAFYQTFLNSGLSKEQALGLMANVEAENSFMPRYLFGTHNDGGNTAYGAISWQGGREKGLLSMLEQGGAYRNGRIVEGVEAANIQARYMLKELADSGLLPKYKQMSGNPLLMARYINKKFVRSSQSPKVLEGRELNYRQLLDNYRQR